MMVIPGEPVAKQRPQCVCPHGGRAHVYTPKKTKDAEEVIGYEWYDQSGGMHAAFSGPVRVSMTFVEHSRKKKDIDNLIKLVLDGLKGLAWNDDTQVESLHVDLFRNREVGGTSVTIEEITDGRHDPAHGAVE